MRENRAGMTLEQIGRAFRRRLSGRTSWTPGGTGELRDRLPAHVQAAAQTAAEERRERQRARRLANR